MDPFTALTAGSALLKGVAGAKAGNQEAANMEAEARLADTQALQRDTQLRDELSRFMSSMQSSRSANGLSNSSPNAMMLMANANKVSSEERTRMTANDKQRAPNLRAGAKSKRRGVKFSLVTGIATAAVPVAQYYA